MNTPLNQHELGMCNKFNVTRVDGQDAPGGKHHGDRHFVLNLTTDKHAIPALLAYAKSCKDEYPVLSADLMKIVQEKRSLQNEYTTVPACYVPGFGIVPEFKVATYSMGRGEGDMPVSHPDVAPWVNISYWDTRKTCAAAGMNMLTASQSASISYQINQVDENWTGGKVGEGEVFMGLHQGTVSCAQPASYESPNVKERRWHVLPNGQRIWDWAGNIYNYLYDDLHGDENGLVGSKGLPKDSPLLKLPVAKSMQKGQGWRPSSDFKDWAGDALLRGGYWLSSDYAGVFYLGSGVPDGGDDFVGFRCTQ